MATMAAMRVLPVSAAAVRPDKLKRADAKKNGGKVPMKAGESMQPALYRPTRLSHRPVTEVGARTRFYAYSSMDEDDDGVDAEYMYPVVDPENYVTDVWKTKPSWCQPWSILLTGTVAIFGAWAIFQTWWLEIIVVVPVLLWWQIFLVAYPKSYETYVLQEVARMKGGGGNGIR